MASPNDPNSKTPEGQPPPDSGDLTPHPRYDEQLEGDAFEVMRKYQVVTLPPNARLKLMQMSLPEAPAELLQDTVPPNGALTSPKPAPATDAITTDAPVVDRSRSNDTVIIERLERKHRHRKIVVAALLGAVALVVLGAILSQTRETPVPQPSVADSPAVPLTDTAIAAPSSAAPATTKPSETAVPGAKAVPPEAAPPETATTPAKQGSRKSSPATSPKATTVPVKPGTPATPSPPANTARGKQPWIDGL